MQECLAVFGRLGFWRATVIIVIIICFWKARFLAGDTDSAEALAETLIERLHDRKQYSILNSKELIGLEYTNRTELK